MDETGLYCYYTDGPCGFHMGMHDARMVGARAKVNEFVDYELIYSQSEQWTLLSGVLGVVMGPEDQKHHEVLYDWYTLDQNIHDWEVGLWCQTEETQLICVVAKHVSD